MFDIASLKSLKKICRIDNFDFSKNTTYGLGGQCRAAFFPKNDQEIKILFDELNGRGAKYIVLGRGSNVLAADNFYNGYVICTNALNHIQEQDGNLVCGAGVTVKSLLEYCSCNSLGGAEFLFGIPASLGGIAYMNGGAADRHIADIINSVTIYNGKFINLSKYECNFGNKHSTMRDINCIITQISLNISASDCGDAAKRLKYFARLRKGQPAGKSCGCVFKNPAGMSAGKLIDKCGLKGTAIGGAKVSQKHANFIINEGGSSGDVYKLIKSVQKQVYDKTGIFLEEEVCYIGDFYETYG